MWDLFVGMPFWLRSALIGGVVGLGSQLVYMVYIKSYFSRLEALAASRGWRVSEGFSDALAVEGEVSGVVLRLAARRVKTGWGSWGYETELQLRGVSEGGRRWVGEVAGQAATRLGGEGRWSGELWRCEIKSSYRFVPAAKVEQVVSWLWTSARRAGAAG